MKSFILSATLILYVSGLAQYSTFDWAISGGGTESYDRITNVAVIPGNGVVSVGGFRDTVDFDPGPGVFNLGHPFWNSTHVFLQRLDEYGTFMWAGALYSPNNNWGKSITANGEGEIYVAGSFRDSMDFDPGPGDYYLPSLGTSLFILKLDSLGIFQWVKIIEAPQNKNVNAENIELDSKENIIVNGTFNGTIDFDPDSALHNVSTNGHQHGFVLKLSKDGAFKWVRTLGANNDMEVLGLSLDVNDHIVSSGAFEQQIDFDPGTGTNYLNSYGGQDGFCQKLDSSGVFEWATRFGGVDNDFIHTVKTDLNGNVYLTGSYKDQVIIQKSTSADTLVSVANTTDFFVQKLSSSGSVVWNQSFGSISTDYTTGLDILSDNEIILSGILNEPIDFDPGPQCAMRVSSLYTTDIFILQLDSTGTYRWVKDIGSAQNQYSAGVIAHPQNGFYTYGSYHGGFDADPGTGTAYLTTQGKEDFYLIHFDECQYTSFGLDSIEACDQYTWIDGYQHKDECVSTYILTNSQGCDSMVTLYLKLKHNSNWTDTVQTCGPYTWIDGNTYDPIDQPWNPWVATINDTNAVGCDSIISLFMKSVINLQLMYAGYSLFSIEDSAQYQWLDCQQGYSIIPGATSQSFTPSYPGVFAVQITKIGCVDTSECKTMNVSVGYPEESLENIKVYPNPSRGNFTVELIRPINGLLTIYDIQGRLLMSKTVSGSEIELHLTFSPGTYILRITDQHFSTLKMIEIR